MPAKKNHEEVIESLRGKIDSIDDSIITLLAERAAYVKEVGLIKNSLYKTRNIIRPGREASMIRNIVTKCKGVFPQEGAAIIWRMIISASITLEEKISLSVYAPEKEPKSADYLGMVREYFGSFIPVKRRKRIKEILEDVKANKETIGAIPFFNRRFGEKWFADFVENTDARVFAILPFINFDPKKPMLLIGKVIPEKTDSDISLFVIQEKKLRQESIENLFAEAGFKAKNFRIHNSPKNVTKPYSLIEIFNFVDGNDEKILKLKNRVEKKGARLYYAGSYATPLTNLGLGRQ